MKEQESKEIQILRLHKESSGLSYEKLGQALGVHSITIYNWFRGKTQPSPMAKKTIRAYLSRVE